MKLEVFWGLVGYYQRFVQDFSKNLGLLTKLTQKGKKYVWIAEYASAFEQLKNRLMVAQILKMLNGTGGMVIYSDASGRGLGAC